MKIGIIGCGGRMGRMLVAETLDTEGCVLVGGIEQPHSPAVGRDLAALIDRPPIGLTVKDEPRALFDAAEVIIDFSAPVTTAANAALAAETGRALVVGTTGIGPEQMAALAAAARRVPVLYSPNMSLGVNVLFAMVEQVSRLLDDSYDIEILEAHHRGKVDAPSGTALGLGRAAAMGRGIDLGVSSQRVRDGHIGQRRKGDIGFATIRGGDMVGEHTVIFATDGERVEMTHKASSRAIFARGAMRAAWWLHGREAGLYSMQDVLGLN